LTHRRRVDVSDDFHFRIQSIESPTLLLRHVSTHGQATNRGELPDAFFALMLSFHPGGYSSVEPLTNSGHNPPHPTLHWHFGNRSCINHHCNSKATYLRLESAALLRELSAQAIAVSQLASLQGVAAPASLVQLIDSLGRQLASTEFKQHRPITETFFNRLGQELRHLLGPPKPSNANAAGHASMAIAWMKTQLSTPINLQQLAQELCLTPRSVQACFKSQLAMSPMRYLKLARISALRQILWDRDLADQSIKKLLDRCGLSDTSLTRLYYKDVYGACPREDRHRGQSTKSQYHGVLEDSLYRQFDSPEMAIRYLETLNHSNIMNNDRFTVAITITSSIKGANHQIPQRAT
jgi:AraC-like DNA-binding protein